MASREQREEIASVIRVKTASYGYRLKSPEFAAYAHSVGQLLNNGSAETRSLYQIADDIENNPCIDETMNTEAKKERALGVYRECVEIIRLFAEKYEEVKSE